MASDPSEYQWSSYNFKAKGIPDPVVDFDSNYRALGGNEQERRQAYQEFVTQTIPDEELKLIREAIQRNQLTGTDRFRKQIEKKHDIRIFNRGSGRPKKRENKSVPSVFPRKIKPVSRTTIAEDYT